MILGTFLLILYGIYLYINRSIRAYAHGSIAYGFLGILVSLLFIGGLPGAVGGALCIIGGIKCIGWMLSQEKKTEIDDKDEKDIPKSGFMTSLTGGFVLIVSIPIGALQSGVLEAVYTPPLSNLAIFGAIWSLIAGLMVIIYCVYGLFIGDFSIRTRKHRCNYCGQMVDVVSDCCRAAVIEHFLVSECSECKKDCKILCIICKKKISG